MLSPIGLVQRPRFSLTAVTCHNDHTRWSETETPGGFRLVLVRRGRFRRRVAGVTVDLDPTVGYFAAPGEEEQFAHPAGGDVCTSIDLAPQLWRQVAGETNRPVHPAVYVDARLELAHRRLLATADRGDLDYALAEQLLGLVTITAGQVVKGRTPASGSHRDSTLVAAARDLITANHPAAEGLISLAELLGVSPYRLSRACTRELGVSLTRYRNRVRVARALDRIEAGEDSLSELAADLGFADQAHLCRTVREHLGHTPTAVRRLLRPPAY